MYRCAMSTSLTFRTAEPADALQIAALLQSIGWFDSYQHGSLPAHAEQLTALLAPSEHHVQLVAIDSQGRLCAYCAVHWLALAVLQGWEGYVSELFVAEHARAMGLGSQLLDHVTAIAKEKGCKRLWLINHRDRDSYQRNFYAQHGWQEQPQAARFVRML